MSNTLNTPVEALELAYPLRVERYALRPGSGGAGAHRGGDGVIRELRVLEDCRLSLLPSAGAAPRGAAGGEAGAPGRNAPERRGAAAEGDGAAAGDLLRVETPGGGGFGRARQLVLGFFEYGRRGSAGRTASSAPGFGSHQFQSPEQAA